MRTRKEKDSLGEVEVPYDACYGVETVRAIRNFPISGLRFHPVFVWATAAIKKAAAEVNMKRGALNPRIGRAIVHAAEEIMAGKLGDQFCVDAFQSGAGVSQHMNTNEVIANRALEILKCRKGDYGTIHPHDHVNMSQSTNDVVPAALRIAATKLLAEFYPAAEKLEKAFGKKSREFSRIVKAGRTHMQDAAPISLGQEFGGYAASIRKGRDRVRETSRNLLELGIGGSAVGTGLNTAPEYRKLVVNHLKTITGFPFRCGGNLFELMQSTADFSALSGSLKTFALSLIQISNDLRLLSSGPKTGFAEIKLPARQPGSSIMPGKINPVIPEVTAIACFQVVGNDTTISFATQAGQLELNVMLPSVIYNLLQSIEILKNVSAVLANLCVSGIEADRKRCCRYAEESYGIAAALNPYLGYGKAAELVKESVRTGKTLREVILKHGLMPEDKLSEILSPEKLTQPKAK